MVKTSPSNEVGAGSIPGPSAKISHASRPKKKEQNIKEQQYCNKFNTDFKNGPHHQKILKKIKFRGWPDSDLSLCPNTYRCLYASVSIKSRVI